MRLSDNEELLSHLKNRFLFWIDVAKDLKLRSKFLNSLLMDYSYVAISDINDIRTRPYRLSDLMERVVFRTSVWQALRRLGYDEDLKELDNFYDLNLGEARRRFNLLLTKETENKPTFRLADYTENVANQLRSNALNFYLQRILRLGRYYTKHFIPHLAPQTIITGTGYTRINYVVGYDIDQSGSIKPKEEFSFEFVPDYRIFDDGIYSDVPKDLEDSYYVAQIHTWDRATAERELSKFLRNKEEISDGVSSSFDVFEDYDADLQFTDTSWFWNSFADKTFGIVTILEVFWKNFKKDGSFDWYRSFFAVGGGDVLREIVTFKSDYVCGVPIIRKKHEISNFPFGYTPIPNIVEINNALSDIYSTTFQRAKKNSYEKVYLSSRLNNLQDEEGNYRIDYKDQVFRDVRVNTYGNESIRNHIYKEEHQPIDPQPIQLLTSINEFLERDFANPLSLNYNRTSRGAISAYLDMVDRAYYPMFLADRVYFTELGEMLYKIYSLAYSDELKSDIKKKYKSIALGIDLERFDYNGDLAQDGLEVVMSAEQDSIRNKTIELILPVLQQHGAEALRDEWVVSLFNLRNLGFEMPDDKEKKNYLIDIHRILSENLTPDDIESMVLSDAVPNEEGQPMKIYDIENHDLALSVIREFLIANKHILKDYPQDTIINLMYYYNLHKAGAEQKRMTEQAIQAILEKATKSAKNPMEAVQEQEQIVPNSSQVEEAEQIVQKPETGTELLEEQNL